MTRILFGLAALVLTAGFAVAQDEPAPQPTTDTVWTVQISGIKGWGAAGTAKKARVALEKVDGIDSVMVDTTARAIIRMKKDQTPTKDALNEAISKFRCKVTSLEKTEIAKPVEAVELSIEGLGWQDTAQSVRETLEKIDGVIYALPDGGEHTVLVHLKKADALTEKSVKELIEKGGKFKLKSFSSKSLVKTKEA